MPETNLKLTSDERTFLVDLLEKTLKDVRVEEHRTRTPSFREFVLSEEKKIAAILTKLGTKAE